MKSSLDKLTERDRTARQRIAAEHARLDGVRRVYESRRERWLMRNVRLAAMVDDGSCCGAPAAPVASAKWAARHRVGGKGGRLPCPRALRCEALWDARRRHHPEWFTPEAKRERQKTRVLDAIARERNPGDADCCGAPRVAAASTKFSMRHRAGFTFGDQRQPCKWARRCQAKYSRQYRAVIKEHNPERYDRERAKAKIRNQRRRTGRPTGRPPGPIRHGTVAGYQKERRRPGVDVCDQCRTAWRNHQRTYRERRKAAPV